MRFILNVPCVPVSQSALHHAFVYTRALIDSGACGEECGDAPDPNHLTIQVCNATESENFGEMLEIDHYGVEIDFLVQDPDAGPTYLGRRVLGFQVEYWSSDVGFFKSYDYNKPEDVFRR